MESSKSKPLKVGDDYLVGDKLRTYNYNDVKYDKNGWADPTKFLPIDGDLVLLKTAARLAHGWIFGSSWDGLNYRKSERVLAWKRADDFEP